MLAFPIGEWTIQITEMLLELETNFRRISFPKPPLFWEPGASSWTLRWNSTRKKRKWGYTVDGRNPAPPGIYIKPGKSWDILHINWCRISSINSMTCHFSITVAISWPNKVNKGKEIPWYCLLHSRSFNFKRRLITIPYKYNQGKLVTLQVNLLTWNAHIYGSRHEHSLAKSQNGGYLGWILKVERISGSKSSDYENFYSSCNTHNQSEISFLPADPRFFFQKVWKDCSRNFTPGRLLPNLWMVSFENDPFLTYLTTTYYSTSP